jgi:hypothetical protein
MHADPCFSQLSGGNGFPAATIDAESLPQKHASRWKWHGMSHLAIDEILVTAPAW